MLTVFKLAQETMLLLRTAGITFFLTAMFSFAVQHLVYATSSVKMTMGYPWIPVSHGFALMVGAFLILACLAVIANQQAQMALFLLAVLLLARALIVFLPLLARNVRNGSMWTPLAELIALSGASLCLLAGLSGGTPGPGRANQMLRSISRLGPFLFSAPLIVFGSQHFIYARFVATLVPAWIPGRLFWTDFVGVCFLLAAAAILLRRFMRQATILLGLMFFSWVVLVHAPRIAAAPRNGYEWTSGFVALAMAGSAWILSRVNSTAEIDQAFRSTSGETPQANSPAKSRRAFGE